MKLLLAVIVLIGDSVVADPAQCFACDERDAATCTANQRNLTCTKFNQLVGARSLGTTHCGSAAITYLDYSEVVSIGFIRGCFDCADKKVACFALGGYYEGTSTASRTLLQCEIECCNDTNCNTQEPTLTKDAITVFAKNASGPTQCQQCLGDDANVCTLKQEPQFCATDRRSLGATHCGTAKIKYLDFFRKPFDGVMRGCINCVDKKVACASIAGFLIANKGWVLLDCDVECCTGKDCNNGVDADGPTQCNVCLESDGIPCSASQKNQTCFKDRNSLGTTHCGSTRIKYMDGPLVKSGLIRGCINCTDKKAACFALGGFLKADKQQTLLQCEIECCNKSNCNTQAPSLSQAAITVFTPDASGKSKCQRCFERDEATCTKRQTLQICANDSGSLGTTHCGSAKIKYRDYIVKDGFFRGCIDCADKKAACAAIGGYIKKRFINSRTLLECDIECCTGNSCNDGGGSPSPDTGSPSPDNSSPSPNTGNQNPDTGSPSPDNSSPSPNAGNPNPDAGSPNRDIKRTTATSGEGRLVMLSGVLVFATTFVNILYHM